MSLPRAYADYLAVYDAAARPPYASRAEWLVFNTTMDAAAERLSSVAARDVIERGLTAEEVIARYDEQIGVAAAVREQAIADGVPYREAWDIFGRAKLPCSVAATAGLAAIRLGAVSDGAQ